MKRFLFVFLLVLLNSGTFGMRRDGEQSLIQVEQRSQCSALLAAIDSMSGAFDCVRDRCDCGSGGGGGSNGGGGGSSTTGGSTGGGGKPHPPTIGPTKKPPLPSGGGGSSSNVVAEPAPSSDRVQVGTYIPNWFVYRKHYMGMEKLNVFGGVKGIEGDHAKVEYTFWATSLEKLTPMLTHLYYAFWNINMDCAVDDSDADASWYGAYADPTWIPLPDNGCKGLMNDMMGLKSRFPHLKLLVSLGGWTYSRFFTDCAKTQKGRNTLIKTTKFWFDQMDPNWGKSNGIWDGIDLDWEFPASPDGFTPDHDKDDWFRFTDLTKDYRAFAASEGRNQFLVTCAISTGGTLGKLLESPENTKAFCDAMDHVNIMAYDMHGKWSRITGYNAPLCQSQFPGNPRADLWISDVVDRLEKGGCELKKLMLGLPNYSHTWTKIPAGPNGNGLFSETTAPEELDPTKVKKWFGWSTFSEKDDDLLPQGLVSWWDLKKTVQNSQWGFEIHQEDCDEDHGVTVPMKWVYSATEEAFAPYDDEEVTKKKAEWARARGLGGFFYWDAQQDKHGDLLKAAREGWGGLPTHAEKSSRPKCYDNKKPDFNLDPVTGKERPKVCQMTNRKIELDADKGIGSCSAAGVAANAECKEAAIVVGGWRPGSDKCKRICSETFGASPDTPQVWGKDVVYYRCKREELESAPAGGGGSGGGSSGGSGKHCYMNKCPKCVAIPGNIPGVTDELCKPCEGGQTWFPCAPETNACQCLG